ncbi:hypothetical protein [Alicyclobacillus shizuokensis]|uniref:hypothetical protein n=1 Tax=Alicyclobacillus shizuokensis TaxID=392014 RepID=UPI000830B8F1|nr:hypothetical protein [Alicyclobacillus shizuokensis]
MANQNGNNSGGRSDYAEIEVFGNLSTIKDPNTGERVHAYSVPLNNGAKVANANLAVNVANKEDPDYWKLEVYASSPDRASMHNFLMDHCYKGRALFVKGTPVLNKGQDGRIYPTIRVNYLRGFGEPASTHNQQQGQQAPAPQNQGGFAPQQGGYPQQGGFGQPQAPQQGGFGQPQGGFQGAPQGGFGQPQGGFNQSQFGAPQGGQGGFAQPGFGGPQGPQGGPQPGGFGAPQGFGAPVGTYQR